MLLNKKDLLTPEDMDTVEAAIQQRSLPGVNIIRCQNCAVPLDAILEVTQAAAAPLVSHEFVRAAYSVPTEAGRMRSVTSRENATQATPTSHMAADKFTSLVFESERPLQLAQFQNFLASSCVSGVSRMKGAVCFLDLPGRQFTFHWSGRKRFELSEDSVIGQRQVQLVVLGQSLDESRIISCLEEACSPPISNGQDTRPATEPVHSDERFDVIDSPSLPSSLAVFQLNGCVKYGIEKAEAASLHGVNFDKMNAALQENVNCASGAALLATIRVPDGSLAVCHASSTTVRLEDIWPTVSEEADKLIELFFIRVRACRCGF